MVIPPPLSKYGSRTITPEYTSVDIPKDVSLLSRRPQLKSHVTKGPVFQNFNYFSSEYRMLHVHMMYIN